MSAKAHPATLMDRDRYRAARQHCRLRSPDLFFAAHFTSKPRRYGLFALDALVRQLEEIMGPPQIDLQKPQLSGTDHAAPMQPAPAPAAQDACCAGGCGDGESVEQRRRVCLAVIDHLYAGLDTGKPELDACLDLFATCPVPKARFASLIEGMAAERILPRYATWKRASQVMSQAAGSRALITAQILGRPHLPSDAATLEAQLLAWGAAIRLCRAIEEIGDDHRCGRIMIPLDDLIRHNLTERDIARFAAEGSAAGDPRWLALMQHLLERIRNLLRGGARALAALADDAARRTFAATGIFPLRRLEQLIKKSADPFATRVKTTTWDRVKAMPRAVRAVWDAQR